MTAVVLILILLKSIAIFSRLFENSRVLWDLTVKQISSRAITNIPDFVASCSCLWTINRNASVFYCLLAFRSFVIFICLNLIPFFLYVWYSLCREICTYGNSALKSCARTSRDFPVQAYSVYWSQRKSICLSESLPKHWLRRRFLLKIRLNQYLKNYLK